MFFNHKVSENTITYLYYKVRQSLFKNGGNFIIHTLVLYTFLGIWEQEIIDIVETQDKHRKTTRLCGERGRLCIRTHDVGFLSLAESLPSPPFFSFFSLQSPLLDLHFFFHGHIHPPHSTVLPFKMSTEPGCSSQWSFISDIYTQRERCLNFLLNRAKWNIDELWSRSFIWDLVWLWANIVHTSVMHIMPFLLSLSPSWPNVEIQSE